MVSSLLDVVDSNGSEVGCAGLFVVTDSKGEEVIGGSLGEWFGVVNSVVISPGELFEVGDSDLSSVVIGSAVVSVGSEDVACSDDE